MSEKKFASYGDMETLVTEIAAKKVSTSSLYQPYRGYIYCGNTANVQFYKIIEKNIGDPASMVTPVHLSGTLGQWGGTSKATFDVEIDFRLAGSSQIVIHGYISNKCSDADIVAVYSSGTIRIYVRFANVYRFADFASNIETIPSPTAVSNISGSVIEFMQGNAVNISEKASTTAYGMVAVDGTTITSNNGVLSATASGGSSIKKTRYTIAASSWSASANASGYYTYSLTLNPTLVTTQPPDVSCAGSTDSTVPTSAQKSQYGLVDYYDNTAANTLVLYAKTKPSSTFYIWVEGNNA